ncbi:Uncharacterised protein [Moraxella bovis]|uniref:Uncharacterized protein n=1 Tax=Moraxella bovis TaxID=476 RepID=A0A378Q065_MORBO|nr:Uncharacterised protein [Moraxella bovis]
MAVLALMQKHGVMMTAKTMIIKGLDCENTVMILA